jgi:hypothetical protein
MATKKGGERDLGHEASLGINVDGMAIRSAENVRNMSIRCKLNAYGGNERAPQGEERRKGTEGKEKERTELCFSYAWLAAKLSDLPNLNASTQHCIDVAAECDDWRS